jgi:cytochrome b561
MPPAGDALRYTRGAIILHGLMAVIIVINLGIGLTIDRFYPGQAALGDALIGLHRALGLSVIVLTLVRIGWRWGHPPPPWPAHMTPLERRIAGGVHRLFYLLMLVLPLTGWAMVSTGVPAGEVAGPAADFGVLVVPPLPFPNALGGAFHTGHAVLGWTMVALLLLHGLAVVKHWMFDRDNILSRLRIGASG